MARGAGAPRVEVEGGAQLRRAFKRLGDRASDLKDLHRQAAEPVAEEARAIVPVLEGGLRGSIRQDRRQSGAAVLAGGARIPYAGVIHFGWPAHNIEPDPFLYDAADRRADEVRDRYAAGIARLVDRFDTEAPD